MSYRIIDLEVTQPLLSITLLPQETGIALIVRRKGEAIGFFMRSLPPLSKITADQFSAWITEEYGVQLIESTLRENLLQERPSTVEESRIYPINPKLPSVTIAICTKDRPEWAVRCVRSLQALHLFESTVGEVLEHRSADHSGDNLTHTLEEKYQDATVEILVIDNAPSDSQTQDRIAAIPGIRYVQELKAGLNFARNRAIQEAKGELLAFMDDDVVVDSDWLMALWRSWTTHPDAGAWTGQVLPYELETEAQILFELRGGFRRAFEPIRFGRILPTNSFYPSAVGICGTGCNMAFRRDMLLKLNGFDEALDTGKPLPGGGDHDIFYRVIRAGYPLIYESGCLVFHQHRREHAQLRRQYWSWGLAIMAFLSKCHQSDPEMRSQVRALMGWWFQDEMRQVLYSLRGKHPLPVAMLLAELWGGVQGLFGEYQRSQSRSAYIRQQLPLETLNDRV